MTIQLIKDSIRINGAAQIRGSQWKLSATAESELVGRAQATYVDEYVGAPAGLDMLGQVLLPGYHLRADLQLTGLVLESIPFSTADGQIVTGECWLYGVRATSGTSPTLDLHKGTSTSDELVLGGLGPMTVGTLYRVAEGALVHCPLGLYGNLGGTTPVFTVFVVRP